MRPTHVVACALMVFAGMLPAAGASAQGSGRPTHFIRLQDGVMPFPQVVQVVPSDNPMRREAAEEIRRISTIRSRIGRPALEFALEDVQVDQDLIKQLRSIREQDEQAQREWEREQTRVTTEETLRVRVEHELKRLNELRLKHGKPPLEWSFERGQVTEETVKQITQEIEEEQKREQN